MTTWYITARKTSPLTPITVEAETRELAIIQVVEQAAEGEQVEVLECTESPAAGIPPAGATGTSSRASKHG